jgi:hypothetical protein
MLQGTPKRRKISTFDAAKPRKPELHVGNKQSKLEDKICVNILFCNESVREY